MKPNYKASISLIVALTISVAVTLTAKAQKVEWVSTTATAQWEIHKNAKVSNHGDADATVYTHKARQTIEGFGACFNELGWTSLSALSATDRNNIFRELFSPGVGANFTVFRMPIGANDFSRKWYSYDETPNDFEMKDFSIDNDKETLIPFIKSALTYNPKLKLWASPWSPPQWMKYNKHYAGAAFPRNGVTAWRDLRFNFAGLDNGLQPDQVGKVGTNMFIQEPRYFEAYALYFSKFVQAYKNEGITIAMVMPQNEFNSPQTFPSATWTAKGLSNFVSYLGPEMNKLGVDIFMGTVEKGNPALVDTVLTTDKSSRFIKGAGFQWDGKLAIGDIHSRYPELPLYQTEHECGNGLNDWAYMKYSWTLLQQYFNQGVKTYEYWNLSLPAGGKSTWGWYQNSLITVDEKAKTYSYNYEYYLMKHFSHYVKAGAKYLETSGLDKNIIAFRNPDKSIVVLLRNEAAADRKVNIKIGGFSVSATLKGDSFNTLLIKN